MISFTWNATVLFAFTASALKPFLWMALTANSFPLSANANVNGKVATPKASATKPERVCGFTLSIVYDKENVLEGNKPDTVKVAAVFWQTAAFCAMLPKVVGKVAVNTSIVVEFAEVLAPLTALTL